MFSVVCQQMILMQTFCCSSVMTSSCFHVHENKKHGGSPYADLYEKALMQARLQHTFSYKPAHD
jgi:hypothetical protein